MCHLPLFFNTGMEIEIEAIKASDLYPSSFQHIQQKKKKKEKEQKRIGMDLLPPLVLLFVHLVTMETINKQARSHLALILCDLPFIQTLPRINGIRSRVWRPDSFFYSLHATETGGFFKLSDLNWRLVMRALHLLLT